MRKERKKEEALCLALFTYPLCVGSVFPLLRKIRSVLCNHSHPSKNWKTFHWYYGFPMEFPLKIFHSNISFTIIFLSVRILLPSEANWHELNTDDYNAMFAIKRYKYTFHQCKSLSLLQIAIGIRHQAIFLAQGTIRQVVSSKPSVEPTLL